MEEIATAAVEGERILPHRTADVSRQAVTNGLGEVASTQVRPQPRRRFTKAYKLRIVEQAEACSQPGEIGALLRREGLYASALTAFRRQQAEGKLVNRAEAKVQQQRRGQAAQRQRDRRRMASLEHEVHQLRTIIEVQKKLSELLNLAPLPMAGASQLLEGRDA